ncbi:hypothetical protein [Actinomyces massiliensis]|uniref:hypothetical protein n=1 Tax=Actinomyces massiliensis TaxID=461393 RepID=UPI0028EA2341|nr:hypothetical protein [Actinomyces massiliensis]
MMARSQSKTVRLLAVMLLGLVMVGAPQPSVAAAPVAGGEAQAVVMPADPPSPTPSPTPETDDQNGGSGGQPAPSGNGEQSDTKDRHREDERLWPDDLQDKGAGAGKALGDKLKSGKEVADGVAKKVAEGANQNGGGGTSGSSSSSGPTKWIKDGLETSAVWIGDMLGRAAAWVVTSILAIVFGMGSPNLGADYIYKWTSRTFAVAIPITITLAFWQLAKSAIQARGLSGVRRAAGGAVVATAASMVTLPILVSLTTGVDELRGAMVSWLGLDVQALSKQITDIFSSDTFLALAGVSPGAAVGAAAAMMIGFAFFCLFVLFFAILLLFVMVLRNLFLQAAAVVTPVAYSGLAADETRSWPRTVLGWLMALLVAPFGIVIVLGLGFLGLSEIDKTDSITGALSQIATCGAALLGGLGCPWVFFKLFSFLGEDAVASMVSQMRGAVVAGAHTVGNTVKSVASAASSPTEGGPLGQTVKSAADQAAYGDTDGIGEQQGQDGGDGQGAGDQQGQDGGEGQKAKVAAAAAAVATGGASAAAGAGAGASAAGSSGSASGAASSSGASTSATSGSEASGGTGSAGSVAAAPSEGSSPVGAGATVGSTGGSGSGLSPASTPGTGAPGGAGSVGSVASAPAEGGGSAGPSPAVGGEAFDGGGGGFASAPASSPAPASAGGSGGGAGSVGSVASAPPAVGGYNSAPPPPPATTYSSSSLYGYNSADGGYGSGLQDYRPPAPADDTDTAVFAVPGGASEPVGADAFVPADDYWEEA